MAPPPPHPPPRTPLQAQRHWDHLSAKRGGWAVHFWGVQWQRLQRSLPPRRRGPRTRWRTLFPPRPPPGRPHRAPLCPRRLRPVDNHHRGCRGPNAVHQRLQQQHCPCASVPAKCVHPPATSPQRLPTPLAGRGGAPLPPPPSASAPRGRPHQLDGAGGVATRRGRNSPPALSIRRHDHTTWQGCSRCKRQPPQGRCARGRAKQGVKRGGDTAEGAGNPTGLASPAATCLLSRGHPPFPPPPFLTCASAAAPRRPPLRH